MNPNSLVKSQLRQVPGSEPFAGGALRNADALMGSHMGLSKRTQYTLWEITIFTGKLTISMAIFNSKLLVYQRVTMACFNTNSWPDLDDLG